MYPIFIILSIILIISSLLSLLRGSSNTELEKNIELYGSEQYGTVAYNLNRLRMCSMSFCILGVFLGVFLKNKFNKVGITIMCISIALLILFQLLPLGYAIYIRSLL